MKFLVVFLLLSVAATATVMNIGSTTVDGATITLANTSTGDAEVGFQVVAGTNKWTMGLDNSVANDPFVLSTTAIGTGNILSVDGASGTVTFPGAVTVSGALSGGSLTTAANASADRFVCGTSCSITGTHANGFGESVTSSAYAGFAAGYFASSSGAGGGAVAFGDHASSSGGNAFAFGTYTNSTHLRSVVIGEGAGAGASQQASVGDHSFSVGFNSSIPTLIVTGGSGVGTLGAVGIGDVTPDALLDIQSLAAANSGIMIATPASTGDLQVQFSDADGSADWTVCQDQSDSDAFAISTTACGTGNVLRATTTDVTVTPNLTLSSTTNRGTCDLTSGTPSTCTATVTAGSTCVCAPVGLTAAIAAAGCAVSLTTTTLTITGPDTVTTTMNYHCF